MSSFVIDNKLTDCRTEPPRRNRELSLSGLQVESVGEAESTDLATKSHHLASLWMLLLTLLELVCGDTGDISWNSRVQKRC